VHFIYWPKNCECEPLYRVAVTSTCHTCSESIVDATWEGDLKRGERECLAPFQIHCSTRSRTLREVNRRRPFAYLRQPKPIEITIPIPNCTHRIPVDGAIFMPHPQKSVEIVFWTQEAFRAGLIQGVSNCFLYDLNELPFSLPT